MLGKEVCEMFHKFGCLNVRDKPHLFFNGSFTDFAFLAGTI